MTPQERFWSKVRKSDGCWTWNSTTRDGRYGSFYLNGRNRRAHRVSFEWANGPIPNGLVVDHICRNPACVRPSHLRAVTQKENLMNGPTIIVAEMVRSECARGHAYSGDNLRITPEGWRECNTCSRDRWRRYRARRRARGEKGDDRG